MSFDSGHSHSFDHHSNRREFLRILGAGFAGMAVLDAASAAPQVRSSSWRHSQLAKHLIIINLSGGPSQIDTFDPKPHAASEFRNIDAACQTAIPGICISENLPRLAARLNQVSLIRSVYHAGPATHAAGLAALQVGGSNAIVLGQGAQQRETKISNVAAGELGSLTAFDDVSPSGYSEELGRSNDAVDGFDSNAATYGSHPLGRDCWRARMLIERGARVVKIDQFATVYNQVTWDMHANGGRLNSTHADYRQTLCPQLDQALAALLDDLRNTGLIDETVVLAVGEMGRTSRINAYGGRDHHAAVWTGLIAGGPIRSGQIIGQSDSVGSEPSERPVSVAELVATVQYAMGITGISGASVAARAPVSELF
jgi:hypothetical protein